MSRIRDNDGTADGSWQDDSEVPPRSLRHACSVVVSRLRGCLSMAQRSAWENGIICASIACVIFSFSSLQVKLTGGRVPVLQLCIIRSSISFCTSVLSGRAAGIKPLFGHMEHFPLLFLRGFFGTLAISTSYVALLTLPLGDAVTIAQMRPPVTAVMARFLLSEPLGVQGFTGCLISVVGVIVLAHPPFLMGGHSDWSQKRLLGTLCGVASTLCASGTSYAIRKIGKNEPALTVALWFHTTTICLMIWPLLAGIPEAAKLVVWRDCLLLLGIASTSFLAQLLMTRSFQLLAAARAAAVSFMGVIYSHILGAVIFHERLTAATAGGGTLIFLGVILVTLRSDHSSSSSNSSNDSQAASKPTKPSSHPGAAASNDGADTSAGTPLISGSSLLPAIGADEHHQQLHTPARTADEAGPALHLPTWLQRLMRSSRHTVVSSAGASSTAAYQQASSHELALRGGDPYTGAADIYRQPSSGPVESSLRHTTTAEERIYTDNGPFAVQQQPAESAPLQTLDREAGSLGGLGSGYSGSQGQQESVAAADVFDANQVALLRGQSPSWASWASWRSADFLRQNSVHSSQQPQQQ